MKLAQALYHLYCDDAGWKNFQGNKCPQWDELPEPIRTHWTVVAQMFESLTFNRLVAMRDRPEMFACTYDGFLGQLGTIFDYATVYLSPGTRDKASREHMMKLVHDGPSGVIQANARFGDDEASLEWARAAVDQTKKRIEELTA
jgi:hypothetical protein